MAILMWHCVSIHSIPLRIATMRWKNNDLWSSTGDRNAVPSRLHHPSELFDHFRTNDWTVWKCSVIIRKCAKISSHQNNENYDVVTSAFSSFSVWKKTNLNMDEIITCLKRAIKPRVLRERKHRHWYLVQST